MEASGIYPHHLLGDSFSLFSSSSLGVPVADRPSSHPDREKGFEQMESFQDSYSLKSVAELPPPFRGVFRFRYFNSLQSECFSGCFFSDINMVISAPTGSGKTVLFELCILRLLSRFLCPEGKFKHIKGTLKTIYIAPSKALVQEKIRDWSLKLTPLGINCLEMTGDNEHYRIKDVQESDIILTTPEKFDAVSRLGVRDGDLSFFSDIALVLIDEVHLLNDPRGAALEAIVSRIKMLSRVSEMNYSPLAKVRFLAVSATIPNISDIAEWLLVPSEGIKRFGEEMRPVKLTTKVMDILMQHSRGKSALVFCSTRKGAQEAAQCLSQNAKGLGYSNPFIKSKEQQERLKEASLSCSDKQMQSCILYGVGYHNGGLCMKDRNLVEGLFLKGDLQILCTTNTLAHGINLPAHTVVIKSTQFFNKEKGLYMEYERSMVLQMCGRAGRPPFDDTGTVIIMTRQNTVHLYENLLSGCETVESQLLSCATEHLNAEIVQLTVSDISLAIEWLKCSYLYVRIKKNPESYGIKRGIPCERLEKHMREICVDKVKELSECGMIWIDDDGFLLKPLEPAKLMTKFYLKFNTMKLITKAPGSCSVEDVLRIISRSEELSWIQLRRNEKKLLNDINGDKEGRLRLHVLAENGKKKRRIQMNEEKIFVLANDCLTGDPLVHDLSLNQDVNSICSNGCRIAKCLKEFFIYKKSYKGTISSSTLARCLHQRLWENSPYLLRQLPGIGMVTAKSLHSAGINSFESMAAADPRRIEILTARKYPFGNHIKESLLSLPPKVEMKIEEAECKNQGKSKLTISLTRMPQSTRPTKQHYADINGKVTVKADLLFEEYVGLDVHEKLVVMKGFKFNSNEGHRDTSAISPYSLPKEIYVMPNRNMSPGFNHKEAEGFYNSNNVQSSMPSFDLLQEESDSVTEPGQIEDKTMSEELIFNRIHEKSKNYPILSTSKSMDPWHLPLILTRKGASNNLLRTDDVVMIDSEDSEAPQEFRVLEARQHSVSRSSKPSCNDLLKNVQTVGCKRASPMELISDCQTSGQRRLPGALKNQRDVSFLGFKSVFSFL